MRGSSQAGWWAGGRSGPLSFPCEGQVCWSVSLGPWLCSAPGCVSQKTPINHWSRSLSLSLALSLSLPLCNAPPTSRTPHTEEACAHTFSPSKMQTCRIHCTFNKWTCSSKESSQKIKMMSSFIHPNFWDQPNLNLYVFYEVANSYELVRCHSNEFIRFLLKRTYFTSSPIRMNSYEWPTPNPVPKPIPVTKHTKSYKWGCMNS